MFGFLTIQYSHAQNISVSVVSDKIVLSMSGPTTVTDFSSSLNAGNDTLTITANIGTGVLSLSGSPSGVSVNNINKTVLVDLVTFNTFAGIEVLGSNGLDVITIGPGGIDLTAVGASPDQSIVIETNNGADIVYVNNELKSKGTGEISINVSKTIVVSADITAEAGGIYLTANLQPTPASGNFSGIDIGANVQTDPGDGGEVYMEALGGNLGNNNHGIYIHGGITVKAGGSSSTTLFGTGGPSSGDDNHGIYIHGASTVVSASGGTVSVIGNGGGIGASSAGNSGVVIHNSGALVTNDGTSAGATVMIMGYGGNGTNNGQIGVDIQYGVASSGGNIQIEGYGGPGAGNSNIGIMIRDSARVHAGGTASLTLTGTATSVQSSSDGIRLSDSAGILSDDGTIAMTGTSHDNSYGVNFTGDNFVSTGNDNDLSITANKAEIGSLSAGTGTIALYVAAGIDIDLGGTDNATTLGFSTDELNAVECSTLRIGDLSQTGIINITDTVTLSQVSTGIVMNTSSAITFSDGIMDVNGRSLDLNASDIQRTSGMLDVSDSNSSLVFNNTGSLVLPQGLLSNEVYELSVNGSGTVEIGDSITITGALALNDGDLSLGSKKLSIHGNIAAMSATNSLIGSSQSSLSIGGTGTSSIGHLYFSTGADTLHTLTLNRTGATGTNHVVALGTDLTITNTLALSNGKIALDSHMLFFRGNNLTGGNASSYIKINGSGGFTRPGGSSIVFPVGYNPYLPVILNCNSCSGTDFTVGVNAGVTDELNNPILTDVVNATWSITASSAQTADIQLQWPGTSELAMPHTGLTLGSRLAVLNPWSRIAYGLNPTGSDPYSVTHNSFAFISGATTLFGIGGATSPLPVDIHHLSADCEKIQWISSSEIPNTVYDIQGSKDGIIWSVIGTVLSNGNYSALNSYEFSLKGKPETFFRLHIVSPEENEFSHIVASSCKTDAGTIIVYPNPASDMVHVKGLAQSTFIRLYNTMGTVVYEAECNDSEVSIDMDKMQKGLYWLHIDGQSFPLFKQ